MRSVSRPSLVERCGLISLAGLYALLWVGGSAWHALTCSHDHHPHTACPAAAQSGSAATCCHPTSSDAAPVSSDTPTHSDHDEDHCLICQWFGQAHAPVVIDVRLDEQPLVGRLDGLPAPTPRTRVPQQRRSRAPPA